MLHFDDSPPRKARIEIIPMIDVMMFLLIFFVLISLNVIPAFGLKSTLPDSSTATKVVTREQPVVITVTEDGTVAVDGNTIPANELGARVRAAVKGDKAKRLVVSAEASVKWQMIVSVMDALRKQGFEAVTFSTKRVNG